MHKIISTHRRLVRRWRKIEKKQHQQQRQQQQQQQRQQRLMQHARHRGIEVCVSTVAQNACHMIEYLSYASGHNVSWHVITLAIVYCQPSCKILHQGERERGKREDEEVVTGITICL